VTKDGVRAGAIHQWLWVPTMPLRVRLDRLTDRWLLDAVRSAFLIDRSSEIEVRPGSKFTDFNAFKGAPNYHRKWRVTEHAGISFTSNIGRGGYPDSRGEVARVGDWILDALSFIDLVRAVTGRLAYSGSGVLRHVMELMGIKGVTIRTSMSTPNADIVTAMNSIKLPAEIRSEALPTVREKRLNLGQLDKGEIVDAVGESFLYQIRSVGGNVDWRRFCAEIRRLQRSRRSRNT
jgi:hypothetical protein